MTTLRRIPVHVRLAVMTAAMLVGSIGAVGAFSILSHRALVLDAVRRDARRLTESLEAVLRVEMLRGSADLGEAVTRIARPEGIQLATLATHRGLVRYATRKDLIGARVGLHDRRCATCHASSRPPRLPKHAQPSVEILNDLKVARSSMAVLNAPPCYNSACHVHPASEPVVGVLQVDVPFGSLAAGLSSLRLALGLILVTVVLFNGAAVFLLIRSWVWHPVAALLRGTRHVAIGDLTRPIPVTQGELGELAAAFNDMQHRLQESQRQVVLSEKLASVGKLAAAVAHEINNPMTGILTFAEALAEETAADDPHLADYKVIHHEALRCRQIVRNLLDFARQGQPSVRAVRPDEVVRQTLNLVSKLVVFHRVELKVQLDEPLAEVRGDANQLQQVFLNLMVNAAEAMSEHGGSLTIRGLNDGAAGMVHLDFVDTGPGIPEERISQIFEPFFSTKGGKTTGLGLAVSWSIVEQHGGKLTVNSIVGKGSTFRVSLPAARNEDGAG